MKKELISLVVPCYNEEDAIPLFYEAIKKQIKKMDYVDFELIFINDGSKDKTLEIIRELSRKDKVVRYVSFSRNFGKEAAMYAGFKNSKGDYVTTMDVDLQDPPYLLESMYKGIKEEGYAPEMTRIKLKKRVNGKYTIYETTAFGYLVAVYFDSSDTAKLTREGNDIYLIYDRTKAKMLINDKGFLYLQIK